MSSSRYQDNRRVADALRAAGFNVESVFDLVNMRAPYPEAIPVLMRCLDCVHDAFVLEGIVRALTCPEARGMVGDKMICLFESIQPNEDPERQLVKWAIGNCLEVVGTEDLFKELVRLACERSHGRAREMIVKSLGNTRKHRSIAISTLIRLLDDETVVGHAVVALGRLGAVEAERELQDLIGHKREWVRREARKALQKIRQKGQ